MLRRLMRARSTPSTSVIGDLSREPTLGEWNETIAYLGGLYKQALEQRTLIESELFPMSRYIVMSHVEDYLRVPDRLRAIQQSADPFDLFSDGLPVGSLRNYIGLMSTLLHYFSGREIMIELGEIVPSSDLRDHLDVLRFWRRAYHGLHARRMPISAPGHDGAQVLAEDRIQQIASELIPADHEVGAAVRRFGATLSAYCFLENCDSRLATCDTGPYRIDDNRFLALRELVTDTNGYYPWVDPIRELLPRHRFVIAYALPTSVMMSTNVWGTARFEPRDFLSQVTDVRVYAVDDEQFLPLAVAELKPMLQAIENSQQALYRHFAQMSRQDRMLCGAQMYSFKTKSWADAAGCLKQLDWDLSPRTLGLYDSHKDAVDPQQIFRRAVMPERRPGSFRPLE